MAAGRRDARRAGWAASLAGLLVAATSVAAAPAAGVEETPAASPAEQGPFAGAGETLHAPGFVVHYANCDGSLPTADRLTLPRRLSRRYADMSAMVRAELVDGHPSVIRLVEGDEPLFEAIHWHVERAQFAPGPPACVMLHYQVVDTVVKASEIINLRVWVDAAIAANGSVVEARVVENLELPEITGAVERQVATWMLEPGIRDGRPAPRKTSLRVDVRLQPTGWTTYSVATHLARQGPRPLETEAPPFPRRLRRIASSGVVVLEFMVSEKGKPFDVGVVSADPKGVFERHAVATIKRWRYQPDAVGGEPVASGPVRQAIRFNPRVRAEDPFSKLRLKAREADAAKAAAERRR
jgi:TonB family protein